MRFLDKPPRFLFFTGKGGVGKTSIACAAAIQLAEAGKRILNLVGLDALRQLLTPSAATLEHRDAESPGIVAPGLRTLVEAIAGDGHGLVVVMGKGGVGKTTAAASIAADLARRG